METPQGSSVKEPPVNPPSLINFEGAELARNQGRKIQLRETASDLSMIHVNITTVRRMLDAGLEAENLGVSKIYNGALVMSASAANEAAELIGAKMRETEDVEALSMLANAQAALTRAVATAVKAAGGVNIVQEKQVKGRRSFSKGAKIGPAIEVQPA